MSSYKVVLLGQADNEQEKIKKVISSNDKYEIAFISCDGREGLKAIKEINPDIVVMDILLQNYDGFEVLENLKNDNFSGKIIVVSSLTKDDFAKKALDLGAGYYMIRPIHEEVFEKRLNDLLNSRKEIFVRKSSKNRALDEKISNIFITVGIPAHIKGYQFLREAIKMAIEEPEIINSITKQLYPSIAERFETSASKVERAIRHAIEVAWNRGKIENINSIFGIRVYNSNEKPTNGEFIALVADKMLVEGA